MPPQTATPPRLNKPVRRLLLLLAVVLLAILGFWLFRSKPAFKDYRVVDTGLTSNIQAELIGDELYAYNGLGFFKTDLKAGNKLTVLRAGTKLPVPSSLHWANSKGVLVTFKSSFTYTLVEQTMLAQGRLVDSKARQYSWYFDFGKNSLTLVNERPVVQGYYSEADNGFYYVVQNSTAATSSFDLNFFSLDSGLNSVVSSGLKITDVGYLGACSDENLRVCLIARESNDTSKEKLFGVGSDGQPTTLLESGVRLFATNKPELVISVSGDDGPLEGREFVDATPQPALLHNLKLGTTVTLGFDVGESDIFATFDADGNFYVLDTALANESPRGKLKQDYRTGVLSSDQKAHTKVRPLESKDGSPVSVSVIKSSGIGSGHGLLTMLDGSLKVLTNDKNITAASAAEESEAEKAVSSCVESGAVDYQYFSEEGLYKIYFTENSVLAASIKSFSDCLVESEQQPLAGYSYYFGTKSAASGRITSD